MLDAQGNPVLERYQTDSFEADGETPIWAQRRVDGKDLLGGTGGKRRAHGERPDANKRTKALSSAMGTLIDKVRVSGMSFAGTPMLSSVEGYVFFCDMSVDVLVVCR